MNTKAHRWILIGSLALCLALCLALPPSQALAQAPPGSRPQTTTASPKADGKGAVSLQAGLGFTADPDSFLMEFEGAYGLGKGFSLGPAVQLGIDDHFVLVSPTVFGRYGVDLSDATNAQLRRLTPYVQAGLGFSYMDRDKGRRDRDEIGFLMNLGFGVDFAVTDHVSLGSRMLFNILPDEVLNENFYFSWQVASIRYRF